MEKEAQLSRLSCLKLREVDIAVRSIFIPNPLKKMGYNVD
jgi:hypothetical protein